jgi:hypothetical protein
MTFERILARERPPAMAHVRLGTTMYVHVAFEVVVAVERGIAELADEWAGGVEVEWYRGRSDRGRWDRGRWDRGRGRRGRRRQGRWH